jgi:putative salt-induced outer membrane protein
LPAPRYIAAALLCAPLAAQATPDLLTVNSASTVLAEAENGAAKPQGMFGSISLGYLASTGNTDSANLNASASFGYIARPWRHALVLRAMKGSTDDETTSEEYEIAEQTDYTFSNNNYVFGALNYSTNRFAGYDRRTTQVLGYGRRVLDGPRHTLDLQVGAGGRQTRLTDGPYQREGIVQLAGGYVWKFAEHASFSQQLRIDRGSENTYTESITAVTANLTGELALSVSYTVKHNSDVPAGSATTDTATAVSLIYGF